jgi:hypothetical protein
MQASLLAPFPSFEPLFLFVMAVVGFFMVVVAFFMIVVARSSLEFRISIKISSAWAELLARDNCEPRIKNAL